MSPGYSWWLVKNQHTWGEMLTFDGRKGSPTGGYTTNYSGDAIKNHIWDIFMNGMEQVNCVQV
jgi:hypothetical protein